MFAISMEDKFFDRFSEFSVFRTQRYIYFTVFQLQEGLRWCYWKTRYTGNYPKLLH
jgi:hypothetical protein